MIRKTSRTDGMNILKSCTRMIEEINLVSEVSLKDQ